MVTMIVCLVLLFLLLCCCACGWYLLCVSVARKKAEDKPALVSVASEPTDVKLEIAEVEDERWSLIALDKLAKVSGSFTNVLSPKSKPGAPPPDRRKTKGASPAIKE